MSKKVALLSAKGGCGKSSSVLHLAMCKHVAGSSVVCLDVDSEVGLSELSEITELPFKVIATDSKKLRKDIQKLEDHDYVFIDTPPNSEAIILKVAALADECIVPCNATIQDLIRLNSTLDAINTIEDARGQALTSVVLTKVKKGTNIAEETIQALTADGIALCDTVIHDSVRYQAALPSYLDEYQMLIKELKI